jgi:hypothetical protein
MIIVKLLGGLGNQMFQYAAGRALAEKYGLKLYLDMSYFREKHGMTPRPFELDKLHCDIHIANRREIGRLTNRGKFRRAADRVLGYQRVNLKENQANPEVPRDGKMTIYLDGYWQSENYFKSIEQKIRSEYIFRARVNAETERLAGEIRGNSQSVSVHIRRGDYLASEAMANFLGVCSIEYYEKALQHISGKIGQIFCYVFSDDLDWVNENIIKGRDNMQAVSHNRNADSWQDMYLMSLCRHHVIANSSFSWWGAWLDPHPDKIVITPDTWFKASDLFEQTKDIIPNGWIRI